MPAPPTTVFLTATNRCNLRCRSCGVWRSPRCVDAERRDRMRTEETIDLIGRLKVWGVRHIAFDTIGEPFLSRSFLDLIGFAHEGGLYTSAVSNGTLLNSLRAEKLVDSGLDALSISIDGPDELVHDALRGVTGAFRRTTSGIKAIRAAQRRHNSGHPLLGVVTVISRGNYKSLPRMAALLRELDVSFLKVVHVAVIDQTVAANLNAQGRAPAMLLNDERFALPGAELHIAKDEQRALWVSLKELQRNCAMGGYDTSLNLAAEAGEKSDDCKLFWDSMFIDVFGNVYPCPMFKASAGLGNVREKPLAEIWQSKAYGQFRDLLRRRNEAVIDLEVCKRCCASGYLLARR